MGVQQRCRNNGGVMTKSIEHNATIPTRLLWQHVDQNKAIVSDGRGSFSISLAMQGEQLHLQHGIDWHSGTLDILESEF